MRPLPYAGGLLALALLMMGCTPKSDDKAGGSAPAEPAAASGTSQYDNGPRAGEQSIDDSKVEAGEKLFQAKGCSACHAFGKRLSCPDLNGVTMRRTAAWMEQQILHPEIMTKQDPISHQLFGEYALQMPNQGLTPDEAKAVIEFLKHENKKDGSK